MNKENLCDDCGEAEADIELTDYEGNDIDLCGSCAKSYRQCDICFRYVDIRKIPIRNIRDGKFICPKCFKLFHALPCFEIP